MKKSNYTVAKDPTELALALKLDPSVAVEWEIRYSLTNKIIETVKAKHFKVSDVAKKAETSRARVTRILKSDTKGISIDVLARVLGAVGQKAKITFKKSA